MLEEINRYFEVVILSSSLSNEIKNFPKAIVISDARSAVYEAIGIAEETQKKVAVILCGTNESRSAFSGMTEAFYRHLPVALFTLGKDVDYSISLNDTSESVHHIGTNGDFSFLNQCRLPAHITIDDYFHPESPKIITLDYLNEFLTERDYLYSSKNIVIKGDRLKCHHVIGGLPGCCEGAIANLLGASLAHKHERYFGILTGDEFLHDVNTIGNVCYNDSIRLICLKTNPSWIECAKSLGVKIADSIDGLESKKSILFTDSEVL